MEKYLKNPLISIITVVFNGENHIERTIKSIISQNYKNIEYIIIDGKSTDSTMNIINKYKTQIAVVVSEKDNGIYDAMNKGINLAKGEYIWFINCGDEVFENNTISKIFETNDYSDVYYGKQCLLNNNLGTIKITDIPQKLDYKSFIYGMLVSHQSIIAKKSLVSDYDLSYKYVSDHDWIIKFLKKSKTITNTNQILSKYLLDGFSQNNFFGCWKDRFKIIRKNYGFGYYLLNILLFLRDYSKFSLKRILKIKKV
ncbi:MAG: hypothetical protein A2086_04510 [Spirochaetes bacterium GWD1_27_9]|nr:MAG: hypothetical protein A2Z98_03455 [Spirochaetes bacterium GWB1_27_13]OHD22727.1 MAG: hypothetical protein A2Y34_00800 [Spirochaetes bacterium GWC1_27_15]OHD28826.1 MAG: hypothetical protein A2086_04510 [Spirochaetes bacterium GWD1_27_9]